LGKVVLKVLETPGHTPEGISLLVIDTDVSPEPQKVLTGDTLFIGDVGRPDLAGARGYTTEAMAGMLYDSLHRKLMTLPDAVEVFPAHGAGSMCGRNISSETHSTIGEQRRFNYALQPMPKEEFVQMVTENLPEQPAYFRQDAEINREGAAALAELTPPSPLEPREVARLRSRGHALLDVRPASEFGEMHVPGSINIGLGGQFASWAGSLIPLGTPIVLIAETLEMIEEASMRLARVGHENVKGYLRGGVAAWSDAGMETESIPQISVEELRQMLDEQLELQVLDVRRPAEYALGHAPRAYSVPLGPRLPDEVTHLDTARPVAVICAGGYRSSAATSLLEPLGFRLLNITGGTNAWIQAGYPTEPAQR
jgi:rhodanese-related sulfurtransferase